MQFLAFFLLQGSLAFHDGCVTDRSPAAGAQCRSESTLLCLISCSVPPLTIPTYHCTFQPASSWVTHTENLKFTTRVPMVRCYSKFGSVSRCWRSQSILAMVLRRCKKFPTLNPHDFLSNSLMNSNNMPDANDSPQIFIWMSYMGCSLSSRGTNKTVMQP